MKKFLCKIFLATCTLVLILGIASVAVADTITWRGTRPVQVTDLSTGAAKTEYIHTATVDVGYSLSYVDQNGYRFYTGASLLTCIPKAGIAASGTPAVSGLNFSGSVNTANSTLLVKASGFSVTGKYKKYASKTNSSVNPNNYSYGSSTSDYSFTNQSISKTYYKEVRP